MVVCFSHLRWDFVWQWPRHLLSHVAQRMPVYVVTVEYLAGRLLALMAEALAPCRGVAAPMLAPRVTPRPSVSPDGSTGGASAAVEVVGGWHAQPSGSGR